MFLRYDEETRTVRSGIRDLIERVMLPEDLMPAGFEPDPMARARAHRAFQESVEGACMEVPVVIEEECGGYTFLVSGRADIVEKMPDGSILVTEVKTVGEEGLKASGIMSPAHRMQLYFYARALSIGAGRGSAIRARLVIVPCTRDDPPPFDLWLEEEMIREEEEWHGMLGTAARLLDLWLARRTLQMERIARGSLFPYRSRRPGQDRLEEIASETVGSGGTALVEAPTGVGKTAAILSGALGEAIPGMCRVFFLTAKNTQRRICIETLDRMRESGLGLAVAVMDARVRMCAGGESRCGTRECPFGSCFGSRVRSSGMIERLLSMGTVDPETLRGCAIEAGVCPFELQLAFSRHCDVIIGDYNYAFDPGVRLRRFFDEPDECSRSVLLVDEAANLPARARDYFSPEITSTLIKSAFPLSRKMSPFRNLLNGLAASIERLASDPELDQAPEIELPRDSEISFRPEAWVDRLRKLDAPLTDELYDVLFAVIAMARIQALAGSRFHLLCRREASGPAIQWFCTDASEFTGERFESCRAAVCFSATLRPVPFHRELLGLSPDALLESLPWPFPVENLAVWIDRFVDTRYRARSRSLPLLAGRVLSLQRIMPGSYLLFFPSYSYMDSAAAALRASGARLLVQKPRMDQAERDAFMDELSKGDRLILTVSGGIFSEGVDLRAPDLRGAVAVGPSLPSFDLRSELLRSDYDERGMDGFLCASVIPGMSRVIQAIGRLIRSPEDRGIVILMDPRFGTEPYVDLLPEHWTAESGPGMVSWRMNEIREFWERKTAAP